MAHGVRVSDTGEVSAVGTVGGITRDCVASAAVQAPPCVRTRPRTHARLLPAPPQSVRCGTRRGAGAPPAARAEKEWAGAVLVSQEYSARVVADYSAPRRGRRLEGRGRRLGGRGRRLEGRGRRLEGRGRHLEGRGRHLEGASWFEHCEGLEYGVLGGASYDSG